MAVNPGERKSPAERWRSPTYAETLAREGQPQPTAASAHSLGERARSLQLPAESEYVLVRVPRSFLKFIPLQESIHMSTNTNTTAAAATADANNAAAAAATATLDQLLQAQAENTRNGEALASQIKEMRDAGVTPSIDVVPPGTTVAPAKAASKPLSPTVKTGLWFAGAGVLGLAATLAYRRFRS